MNKYLMVMNTCPDAETAEAIANMLVDRQLAACVNIIPGIRSIYNWEGKRTSGEEHLLLIKISADNYSEVETAIESMHPYELAEIIAVSIEQGLPAYLNWIDNKQ